MDVTRIPTMSSSHDCGSLSRVVMVRKTDQRMINHKKPKAVRNITKKDSNFVVMFISKSRMQNSIFNSQSSIIIRVRIKRNHEY